MLSPCDVVRNAAAEVRRRAGHTGGAFPLSRIARVAGDRVSEAIQYCIASTGSPPPPASLLLPVTLVALYGITATSVAETADGAIVAANAALQTAELRWELAKGLGFALLHLGWLTGAPLLAVTDDAPLECALFAAKLLAPSRELLTSKARLLSPEEIARELLIPPQIAKERIAAIA